MKSKPETDCLQKGQVVGRGIATRFHVSKNYVLFKVAASRSSTVLTCMDSITFRKSLESLDVLRERLAQIRVMNIVVTRFYLTTKWILVAASGIT